MADVATKGTVECKKQVCAKKTNCTKQKRARAVFLAGRRKRTKKPLPKKPTVPSGLRGALHHQWAFQHFTHHAQHNHSNRDGAGCHHVLVVAFFPVLVRHFFPNLTYINFVNGFETVRDRSCAASGFSKSTRDCWRKFKTIAYGAAPWRSLGTS